MMTPLWKEFERVAFEIQKDLAPGADVKLDQRLPGHESKTNRQIDILVRQNVGQFEIVVVIDCKHYGESIDVNDVGQFASLVQDVRAHKGAMITKKGFSDAALRLAESRGVETYIIVDTQTENDWRRLASIPALLRWIAPRRTWIQLKDFSELSPAITNAEWPLLDLYEQSGEPIGVASDVIASKWNNGDLPHKSGMHKVVLVERGFVGAGDVRCVATAVATVEIVTEHYFGKLPIDLKGLRDERRGGVLTREFTTSAIEPALIAAGKVPGWHRVEKPSDLAARPVLRMEASPVLPRLSEMTEDS